MRQKDDDATGPAPYVKRLGLHGVPVLYSSLSDFSKFR